MSNLLSELRECCDMANGMLRNADRYAGMTRIDELNNLSSLPVGEFARFSKMIEDQRQQIHAAFGNFTKVKLGLQSIGDGELLGSGVSKLSPLSPTVAEVWDNLKTTVGHQQAAWSNTLISQSIPDLRTFLPATLGLDLIGLGEALKPKRWLGPDHFFHHVLIVASGDASEEEIVASLRFLREKTFEYPIALKRRLAHKSKIEAAIRERLVPGKSREQVWADVVDEALFIVCNELKLPRERTCLVEDGKRQFYEGLIAWEDLGIPELQGFIQNRLSDEIMDLLVPDWRDFDTKERAEVAKSIVAFDEPDGALAFDQADPRGHMDVAIAVGALLECPDLSKDERLLMQLMVDQDLGATAAGRAIGKSKSWGCVTLGRIRKKLKISA